MKPGPFVLDNSVLSAFHRRGWVSGISVHHPDRDVYVPRIVWRNEFLPEHEVNESWGWLEIREASRYPCWKTSKSLSNPDLACLGLAEEYEGTVITNDKHLIDAANNRKTQHYWGTQFLLETLEACGIPQDQFDEEKRNYVDDVHLPEKASNQLLAANKR